MQTATQKTKWRLFVLALSMTLSSFTWAQQPAQKSHPTVYTVYDNFVGKFINPSKWNSQYQCDPGSAECVREIVNGRLRLRIRAYGATSTSVGNQFGVSELYLTASGATDIATAAVIGSTSAQGCLTNSGEGAHGQALLFGAFFNGGGGTAADDVQAFLQLDRYSTDTPGVVPVGGFLFYQGQFFGNVQVGQVNVGERVIVELVWDRPNHRFIARLIRPSFNTIAEQSMPYTIPDTVPAVAPFKALSARAFAPNCGGTQTFADMELFVDNVSIGQ